ncbi:MAG: hypothetical protein JO345_08465 [Streptosporangiaceae bacterium]|nr:hypothetical protein [Streptosporangiaceae bacterium]
MTRGAGYLPRRVRWRARIMIAAGTAIVGVTLTAAAPQAHADGGTGLLGGFAAEANNGDLTTLVPGSPVIGPDDTGLGMAIGTSPSIASVPTSQNYRIAFEANTSNLWVAGPGITSGNTGLGMPPCVRTSGLACTSPSIAVRTNGNYVVAFMANTGDLWFTGPGIGSVDTRLGVAGDTSPSIAALPNGEYVAAFQSGSNDDLWFTGPGIGTVDTGQVMLSATSPSITVLSNGEYVAAFQNRFGDLMVAGPGLASSPVDTGQFMANRTSPSITGVPNNQNGYQIAFQGHNGSLWTTGALGTGDLGQGMRAGTSPSIINIEFSTSLPNPPGGVPGEYLAFDIAYQGSNGDLVHETDSLPGSSIVPSIIDTGLAMNAQSSPSNAPFSF